MKTAANYLSSQAWIKAVTELFGEQTEAQLAKRAEDAAFFANEAQAEEDDYLGDTTPDFPLNMESEGH